MKPRFAILATALLVIALIGWLARSGPSPSLRKAPDGEPAVPIESRTSAPLEEAPSASQDTSTPSAETAPIALQAPAAERSEEGRRIVGTIVVVDERGEVRRSESGSLTVRLWWGGGGDVVHADVTEGAWHADAPAGAHLSIIDVRLGDRDTIPEADATDLVVPADGQVALFTRWLSTTLLHVRDAASGRELSDVELVESAHSWWFVSERMHPGPVGDWNRVVEHVTSPIEIGELLARRIHARQAHEHQLGVSARCPGYAWRTAFIDVATGIERFIDLVPGGDLDVHVVTTLDMADVCLVLRSADPGDRPPCGQVDLARDRDVSFDGLVPGSYVASIECRLGGSSRPLDSAPIEIVAGKRSRLELHVDQLPQVGHATLAGRIRVPKAWKRKTLSVRNRSLDSWDEDPDIFVGDPGDDDGFDVFPFRVRGAGIGRHWLQLFAPPFQFVVNAAASGTDNCTLDVPPPGSIFVHVVDEVTGVGCPFQSIDWSVASPNDSIEFRTGFSAAGNESDVVRFDAPQTQINICLAFDGESPEYTCDVVTVDVHEGRNDVVLPVTRTCGFRVRVIEGDAAILMGWGMDPVRGGIRGDGTVKLASSIGTTCTFFVSTPGRYRFDLPKLDGYRAVPEQEVAVEAGQLTDHVIRLERER